MRIKMPHEMANPVRKVLNLLRLKAMNISRQKSMIVAVYYFLTLYFGSRQPSAVSYQLDYTKAES
jgi:hypothetical protein